MVLFEKSKKEWWGYADLYQNLPEKEYWSFSSVYRYKASYLLWKVNHAVELHVCVTGTIILSRFTYFPKANFSLIVFFAISNIKKTCYYYNKIVV